MTPSTRSTLCYVALLVLASCSSNPHDRADEGAMNASGNEPAAEAGALIQTVKALEVKSTGPARMIQGEFEIRAPHPGEKSISSLGIGGACLLAQIPNNPVKACTSDDECHIPPGKPDLPDHPPKFWGYCLSGQCWVKRALPTDPYCNKGVTAGKHSVPVSPLNPGELYTYAAANGSKTPIQWRVFACLNGQTGDPKEKTCITGHDPVLHDAGNPRSVP